LQIGVFSFWQLEIGKTAADFRFSWFHRFSITPGAYPVAKHRAPWLWGLSRGGYYFDLKELPSLIFQWRTTLAGKNQCQLTRGFCEASYSALVLLSLGTVLLCVPAVR
jgi:hypothetical protein